LATTPGLLIFLFIFRAGVLEEDFDFLVVFVVVLVFDDAAIYLWVKSVLINI
jgi:hypothetical protein